MYFVSYESGFVKEAFQEDSVSFFQFKRAAELLGLRVTEAQLRAAFTPFQERHRKRNLNLRKKGVKDIKRVNK